MDLCSLTLDRFKLVITNRHAVLRYGQVVPTQINRYLAGFFLLRNSVAKYSY